MKRMHEKTRYPVLGAGGSQSRHSLLHNLNCFLFVIERMDRLESYSLFGLILMFIGFLPLLHIIVNNALLDKDYVLPLPTLNHVQILQCRNGIFRLYSCLHGNILYGNVFSGIVFR